MAVGSAAAVSANAAADSALVAVSAETANIAGVNGILAALSKANVTAGSALAAAISGIASIAGANGALADELTKAESDTHPQYNK